LFSWDPYPVNTLKVTKCLRPAENIADALFEALEASDAERSGRIASMRTVVQENNIYSWAAQYLRALLQCP
jgi:trehalose-6-phosphate synthase